MRANIARFCDATWKLPLNLKYSIKLRQTLNKLNTTKQLKTANNHQVIYIDVNFHKTRKQHNTRGKNSNTFSEQEMSVSKLVSKLLVSASSFIVCVLKTESVCQYYLLLLWPFSLLHSFFCPPLHRCH